MPNKIEGQDDIRRWRVFLTASLPASYRPSPRTITISTDISTEKNGIGSGGLRTHCNYAMRGLDESIVHGTIEFGFITEDDEKKYLSQILSSPKLDPSAGLINARGLNYFSLMPSLREYRQIVDKLGPKEARAALLALRDLVAVQLLTKRPAWVAKAVKSHIFLQSMIQSSESNYAYRYGVDALLRQENQATRGSISDIKVEFRLPGFTADHQFKFAFDHAGPLKKRIAIIIGQNGAGKSRALGSIVSAALRADKSVFSTFSGQRVDMTRLIALGTPGETINTFPSERPDNPNVEYRRLSMGRGPGAAGFGPLAEQLAKTSERIKENSRWRMFLNSISEVLDVYNLVLPIEILAVQNIKGTVAHGKYIRLRGLDPEFGDDLPHLWGLMHASRDPMRLRDGKPVPLSSGELSFLRFALQACLFIERGSLVLIDEPETHLHPALISKFAKLLDQILKESSAVAIIATHSAYLVREVARSQVHIVKVSTNLEPTVMNPRLRTFGAEVGSISAFVFDDNLKSDLLEDLRQAIPPEGEKREEFFETLKDDLSLEAIMKLRRNAENKA